MLKRCSTKSHTPVKRKCVELFHFRLLHGKPRHHVNISRPLGYRTKPKQRNHKGGTGKKAGKAASQLAAVRTEAAPEGPDSEAWLCHHRFAPFGYLYPEYHGIRSKNSQIVGYLRPNTSMIGYLDPLAPGFWKPSVGPGARKSSQAWPPAGARQRLPNSAALPLPSRQSQGLSGQPRYLQASQHLEDQMTFEGVYGPYTILGLHQD